MNFQSPKDSFVLSNGSKIPCLGLGVWQSPAGDVTERAVLSALECGYVHIDTAQLYRNEQSVGAAVKASGIDRKELFITTKISIAHHSYAQVISSTQESLEKLQTDYVDLMLVHWPNPIAYRADFPRALAETWRAMEELYDKGVYKNIGISNFRAHHIDALLEFARIRPVVNQIKLCPGESNREMRSFCAEKGILLEAYSPLGTGKIFDVPEMAAFAQKYGRTVAQICIRWSLQMGFLPLPKSVTPERIDENCRVFDFELEQADVDKIASFDFDWAKPTNPDTCGW